MIRAVLTSFGLIVLAAAVPCSAQAQFYKGKTITMIVNYPAGGPTDLEGRIVALHLPGHIPGNPTVVVKSAAPAALSAATTSEKPHRTANRSAFLRWTCPASWSPLRR